MLLLLWFACTQSEEKVPEVMDDTAQSDTNTTQDTAKDTGKDSGKDTDTKQDTSTDSQVIDDTAVTEPSIAGVFTRSVEGDSTGTIYVIVLDASPENNPSAHPVLETNFTGVDLSAPGANYPYQIKGLVPRTDAYYVAAYLDGDENSTGVGPPGAGDLIATCAGVTCSAVLDQSIEVTLNLNFSIVAGPPP